MIDPFPLEIDLSFVEALHSGDQIEERGFAGAVRTYESRDLARLQGERAALNRRDAAEALRHAAHVKDKIAGHQTILGRR